MDTLTMARRKKEVTPNRQLAQAILDQYHPKSVEDMQEALKALMEIPSIQEISSIIREY